jgi:hypothetical protein
MHRQHRCKLPTIGVCGPEDGVWCKKTIDPGAIFRFGITVQSSAKLSRDTSGGKNEKIRTH